VPLLVLAVAMVPLLVPLLVDLPATVDSGFLAADWFVWAVFAVQYGIPLSLTDKRWRFVRRGMGGSVDRPDPVPATVADCAVCSKAYRSLRLLRLAGFAGIGARRSHGLVEG
jgi:hypothetical protein